MANHSVIGASGYYRWSECPGSVRLTKDLPPKTNQYAEAGTLAHSISEDILQGKISFEEASLYYEDEMVGAVKVYVDFVESIKKRCSVFKVEHAFDMSFLHPGLFGTCDFVGFDSKNRTLIVADFKYGSGHFVEVENNSQLLYYALGAFLSFASQALKVELYIVQPRCPRKKQVVHTWSCRTVPELLEFLIQLVHDAKRTEESNAPLKEGSWCFFCPAVGFCPAQHEKRLDRAKEQFLEFPLLAE